MTHSHPSQPAARPRVAMIQGGARLHYAVPLALHQAGILERLFTEWYSAPWSLQRGLARLMAQVKPNVGRRMLERWCPDLPRDRVVSSPLAALRTGSRRGRFIHASAFFQWEAQELGRGILRHGFGASNALLGFVRNLDPALCETARSRGLVTVADQIIAPAAVELAEAHRQAQRFPGWETTSQACDLEPFVAWEERTWAALDHLTCASDYVRDGLIAQGIAPQRISVLPYPFDASHWAPVDRRGRSGPLTVGFVGGVNLRKGAPYYWQVARRLSSPQLRFVMIGPVQITEAAVRDHRGPVELVGPVPRSQIRAWLDRLDVFFFPSTCEGSAGALMEAMASGLPVLTSPNSGSVVRDGVDGFVLPYDDLDGYAHRLERLARDPDLRQAMGQAAQARAGQFSIAWYAGQLAELFGRLMRPKSETN